MRSQESPPELLYVAVDNFAHPILTQVAALPDGFTELTDGPAGPSLDFIRGNLFQRDRMLPAPTALPGPENDLGDYTLSSPAVSGGAFMPRPASPMPPRSAAA